MNLLSNTVIAFRPRRPHIAIAPPVAARHATVKPVKLVCRWDRSPVTGRIHCVWTSSANLVDVDAPASLSLAS